jgi:hypothetical protein
LKKFDFDFSFFSKMTTLQKAIYFMTERGFELQCAVCETSDDLRAVAWHDQEPWFYCGTHAKNLKCCQSCQVSIATRWISAWDQVLEVKKTIYLCGAKSCGGLVTTANGERPAGLRWGTVK